MSVSRYIISNPTMVKNADGIVEAYKPGEHIMVMAYDFDAVAKQRAAVMQSLDLAVEKAEEFRKERDALKGRLAEAEFLLDNLQACVYIMLDSLDAQGMKETVEKSVAYFDKYQEDE